MCTPRTPNFFFDRDDKHFLLRFYVYFRVYRILIYKFVKLSSKFWRFILHEVKDITVCMEGLLDPKLKSLETTKSQVWLYTSVYHSTRGRKSGGWKRNDLVESVCTYLWGRRFRFGICFTLWEHVCVSVSGRSPFGPFQVCSRPSFEPCQSHHTRYSLRSLLSKRIKTLEEGVIFPTTSSQSHSWRFRTQDSSPVRTGSDSSHDLIVWWWSMILGLCSCPEDFNYYYYW